MANSNSDKWSVGQRSETGYVRRENQDRMSWIRAPAGDVFVVSDGMGGHAGGAIAAELTVQSLQKQLSGMKSLENAGETLRQAFTSANETVYLRGQTGSAATAHMGATAVALLAAGPRIMLAHVGDSRAYRLTRRGALQRLTKDHSLVQRLVDAGTLTPKQAANHPDSSVLERAMGQGPQVEVEVSQWLPVNSGDVCMLCSDGLCGYVDDEEIAAVMRHDRAPQDTAEDLVRLALERGGEDNVTVQVLRYGNGNSRLRRWLSRGVRMPVAMAAVAAVAAVTLSSGWFGTLYKQLTADKASHNASAPVAQTTSAASPGPLPALAAPAPVNTAASIARPIQPQATASNAAGSVEARLSALERDIQKDTADRRALDNDMAKQLQQLRARIDQLDKKASITNVPGTSAAPRARKSPPAANNKRPAQNPSSSSSVKAAESTPAAAASAAPASTAASAAVETINKSATPAPAEAVK